MVSTDLPRPQAPVAPLRGAGVEIDGRRVARYALATCLLGLVVAAVVLTVAGIDKNNQIQSLRAHGVPVEVTVRHCTGLMGGSGSNLDGFSCSGSFVLAGHRYSDPLPGTAAYQLGEKVRAITVPDDPSLLSTRSELAAERSSWRVFLAPLVLFGIVLVASGVILAVFVHRRRHPASGRGDQRA